MMPPGLPKPRIVVAIVVSPLVAPLDPSAPRVRKAWSALPHGTARIRRQCTQTVRKHN